MSELPTQEQKFAGCSACHQVWPEAMMIRIDNRMLCQLCKERALDSKKRYVGTSAFDIERLRNWGIVVTILAVVGTVAFRLWLRSSAQGGNDYVANEEEWHREAPAQWPVIVGANDIQLDAPEWRAAPNAFLIERPDQSLVGATVLLGKTERSEPSMKPEVNFTHWKLNYGQHPPAVMGGLVPLGMSALDRGVLLADATVPANAPITSLKLRAFPYAKNVQMTIIVAGSAGSPAKTYPVTVNSNESSDDTHLVRMERNLMSGRERVISVSGDGSNSLFELSELVQVETLHGAPIVDAFGHVAAIVTGPTRAETGDGMVRRVRAFGVPALKDALGSPAAKK